MFRPRKAFSQFALWWHIHVRRFVMDLKCLKSNTKQINGRYAREDITHAYVNMYVELIRSSAYLIGHVLAVAVPLAIIEVLRAIL